MSETINPGTNGKKLEALLALDNVVGYGMGLKRSRGENSDTIAVMVLVQRKLPMAALADDQVIPRTFGGLQTDVMDVGYIRAYDSPRDRHRPVQPGTSVGHYKVTAGTLGAFVRDVSEGYWMVLSNNHVLANSNDARIPGDPILQPGTADGGKVATDRIGDLYKFIPIVYETAPADCPVAIRTAATVNLAARALGRSHRLQAVRPKAAASENYVDAALCRLDEATEFDPSIRDIGTIDGIMGTELGMPVRKSGRTSGLTFDVIRVIGVTLVVAYGSRMAKFTDQILTGPMLKPGDSGSLLVHSNSQKAVGLGFAGSDKAALHNPIGRVLEDLDVTI